MINKNKKIYFIIGGIVVVLLIGVIASFFLNRVKMNPAGTIGNTAGNLNNSGLFCEYDGKVYFSNASDNGALYVMNTDETDAKKLNTLQVQNILAAGDYLYYFQRGSAKKNQLDTGISSKSFNRSNLKGTKVEGLSREVVVSAQLVDNYIYMLTATNEGPVFSKIKIDKSDEAVLVKHEINPSCAVDGAIYYSNTQDNHYLRAWDTSTDQSYDVWSGDIWNPIVQGDYVYYMDVAENYRLCRYSMSMNVVEVLTNDRVDCYNIGGGYIYYQKNGDEPQLKCMRMDGSDVQVIADGNFTNINMTSQYVYFQDFNNKNMCYHSFIGSTNYSAFVPQE